MDSVADNGHRCAECGRGGHEVKFRLNGSGRLRKYCEACGAARVKRLRTADDTPTSTALVPTHTEAVTFEGRTVPAVWVEWQRYWPVKPAVEAAGIDWSAQLKRIKSDARLARSKADLAIETPAGARVMVCLPWEAWHYFWTGVTDDVNEAARPTVERIKDEAYAALAAVFGDKPKVAPLAPAADSAPIVVRQLSEVRDSVLWLRQWATDVDQVRRTIQLRGGLYLVRFRDEELVNPAAMLTEFGITDAAQWFARGYMLVKIGKTGDKTEKRVKRHNGSLPLHLTYQECSLETDDPDTGENYLRNNAPPYPIALKVKTGNLKDWFWLRRDALGAIKVTWPRYATIADVTAHCRGWMFTEMSVVYAQGTLL